MARDSMLQHKLAYLNRPCGSSEPSQILAALKRMAKGDTVFTEGECLVIHADAHCVTSNKAPPIRQRSPTHASRSDRPSTVKFSPNCLV